MSIKKKAKIAYRIWKVIAVILISIVLIPLFLANLDSTTFFTWWILVSLFIYLVLTYWHLRLKHGKVKSYIEGMATRLLIAMVILVVAFLLMIMQSAFPYEPAFIVSAVLYAYAIQNIFFLRVIGL